MSCFSRFMYQPVLPFDSKGRMVTICKAHLVLSKKAAIEGIVLLKNDGTLPLSLGSRVCLFGRAAGDFIFGGGGSGMVFSKKRLTLLPFAVETLNTIPKKKLLSAPML